MSSPPKHPQPTDPPVKSKHRRLVWGPVAALAVLAVAGAAVGARVETEPLPPASTVTLLRADVHLPGPPAYLAWPTQGEAALATSEGRLIGSSGPATAVPIASVTKVMTAYVVLSDHPLTRSQGGPVLVITASEAAHVAARLAAGQSVIAVHAGETFDEHQALQALLLASANNMATALARFDAGSKAAFVAKMNSTAAALGMTQTHFADASGYDAGSVSDPTDLLALARAAMRVPAFAAIVRQAKANIPGVATFANYNTLVGEDGFTGIKTGSTEPAGGALLFSVTRDVGGRPLSIDGVVLQQRSGPLVNAALDAAKALADSFYAHLASRTVLSAGTPVATITRAGRHSTVSTTAPLQVLALPGTIVRLRVTVRAPQPGTPDWHAEVGAGALTGVASVKAWGPVPPPPRLSWRLRHLLG